MVKSCIICGLPAGSNEHVFPAVLGGRRTNRGIYCTIDNNKFGRHVAVIEKQLGLFNAILMVRPDRRATPKSFEFEHVNGENYSILGENINIAAPNSLNKANYTNGEKATLSFATKEQCDEWISKQRKDKWNVEIVEFLEVKKSLFIEPVKISLSFGGFPMLQAVIYLALTYFAQYFPCESRQTGFETLKEFLKFDFSDDKNKVNWSDNFIRWDNRDTEEVVGENPFLFGHTVVVGIRGSDSHAYAFFSFFSFLNFVIDLGLVEKPIEKMVKIFINPKADAAPDDIKVLTSDNFSIDIDLDNSDFREMINSGKPQEALDKFFKKVSKWQFDLYINDIQNKLDSWKSSSLVDYSELARTLLPEDDQPILNILKQSINILSNILKEIEFPKYILYNLNNIIVSDSKKEFGVGLITKDKINSSKKVIAESIEKALASPIPNAEYIARIISGGEGIHNIIFRVLLPYLIECFLKDDMNLLALIDEIIKKSLKVDNFFKNTFSTLDRLELLKLTKKVLEFNFEKELSKPQPNLGEVLIIMHTNKLTEIIMLDVIEKLLKEKIMRQQ